MVRYGLAAQERSFSPSESFSRVSCVKRSLMKGKCRSLSALAQPKFTDARHFNSLTACSVQVEPLSSLPVEYASVVTKPCSIVCEVASILNQEEDFQIQINRDEPVNIECHIALPVLPLSLQDYASPKPSLVPDSISMYTNIIGGRTIW
ncbi:hypothetical protein Smp_012790 [Schistosoma mansoni]|uniref:Uncharacterized protein n=1 Tax=Schistosoma mansoni TaxID=6183 RepID=G4V9G8_SCHMA|nr:hypothetical protein Smp_012790 [Schistosoma mansoni]|eukprot:XP_018648157.1 hypothetical protein Smp_012790 [Schistosoma mansoni]